VRHESVNGHWPGNMTLPAYPSDAHELRGEDVTAILLPQATPRLLMGLLLSYPALIFVGYMLIPTTSGPAPVWPADAVLFVAFLVTPPRSWLLVGLAAAAVELVSAPLASHVVYGRGLGMAGVLWYLAAHLLTDVGPVIVARGLRRYLFGPNLQLVASPMWLLAILLGVLPGAVLGDWLIATRSGIEPAGIDAVIWMLSAVLSIALFAPALALILGESRDSPEVAPGVAWEAVAIAGLIVLVFGWRGFMPSPELARVPSLMLLMFPISWLALRFSRRTVYVAVPAIGLAVAFVAAHGFGSFRPVPSIADWQNPMVNAQLSMLAVCGAAMFISNIEHKQRRLLSTLKRERSRLRWYAAELDHAEDGARQRTAEDLHDGIAQTLTGQSFLLAALRQRLGEPAMLELLSGAEAASAEAQQHVRELIADLSPAELESTNLRELMESMGAQFQQRYRFPVVVEVAPDAQVPVDTLRLLFRIVRELIFNAYRHSHGTQVHVRGSVADNSVLIEVFDDGIGFSRRDVRPRTGGHGLGLIQLFERVDAVGGTVKLGSRNGIASLVTVTVPLHFGGPAMPQD
jgi:signal transduction histidine kinase